MAGKTPEKDAQKIGTGSWKTSSSVWKSTTAIIMKKRNTPQIGVQSQKPKERMFTWSNFDIRAFRWITLLIICVVSGVLLTPGFTIRSSSYDDSWLGKVSAKDIRAAADYNIEDRDTTEKKRSEAMETVNPIYEYYIEQGLQTEERIDRAFMTVRQIMEKFILDSFIVNPSDQVRKDYNLVKGKTSRLKIGNTRLEVPSLSGDPERYDVEMTQISLELSRNFDSYFIVISQNDGLYQGLREKVMEARAEFNRLLQAVIPEDEYLELFAFQFSEEIKIALKRIVHDVSANKIVKDRELLEKGAKNEITIRIIKGDTVDPNPAEYTLYDLSSILDTNDLNTSIWRYTTVFSELGARQRKLLQSISARVLQPNLVHNRSLTSERLAQAAGSVKTVVIPVKKGEIIIRDGERFEKRHLTILEGIERELSSTNPLLVFLGYFLVCGIMIIALYSFARKNVRKFNPSTKDLILIGILTLLFLLGVKSLGAIGNALASHFPVIPINAYYYMFPVSVGAALIRVVLNSETAIFYAIFISFLFAVFSTDPVQMSVYATITGVVAADSVGQCKTRAVIFFAGLRTALAAMLLVLLFHFISGEFEVLNMLVITLAAGFSGILMSVILLGLAPVVEFVFDYTTNIKLLELGNLNHPLLKRLIVEAPGTYHHSIIVGSLVESAAEYIHANPLLARVAAYYHDIGKMKNSIYFGENQSGDDNPHDRLSPNMSVLILLSHVKEGRELAQQHNLGSALTNIIEQHHGTSLIRYFWLRAQEMKERGENVNDNEADYRYPGPKPQTREAGLVMLADSVEAATRSLQKPTPERIQGMVQRVINMIFRDGQLNECEITLKDLHMIARAFTQTLVALYHNRPVYPGQREDRSSNGSAAAQQAKKTQAGFGAMEAEDDEDIKRLGSE